MAVVSNLNTKQTPMTATGSTGAQSTKFIAAPRVYVKTVDATPAPPTVKSNGGAGAWVSTWTDLGVVNGLAKVTYTKSTKDARTGIEQVLRGKYIDKKSGTVEADLAQLDDALMAQLTGLTASVVTSGSVYTFGVGQESLVNKAIVLVTQNVLDGKEIQFYNPNAYINFSYQTSGDEMFVKMEAEFPFFTWNSVDTMYVQTHLA